MKTRRHDQAEGAKSTDVGILKLDGFGACMISSYPHSRACSRVPAGSWEDTLRCHTVRLNIRSHQSDFVTDGIRTRHIKSKRSSHRLDVYIVRYIDLTAIAR